MTPQVVFVAGAHTEIGKTHAACALIRAARAQGRRVAALKPVVSGFDAGDGSASDPARLLAALGVPLTATALAAISPWRFAAPLAPPLAARQVGQALPFEPIVTWCAQAIAAAKADLVVVEGVGGLMSPIADGATCLDLILALAPPVVLVGGAYLGAISHTLTAMAVLSAQGAPARAVVISESADPGAPDFVASAALLAEHAGDIPVLRAPRHPETGWAARALALAGD